MSKADNLTDFVVDLADAIREAEGTSELINPQDFSVRIRSLSTGGGITGKPIEVTELPTPTASDVDKIYLLKKENTTFLSPQVGQPFGNKIYFNTELNPLDYTSNFQGGTDLLRTETTDDYYSLGFVDILALQGIEGYGHAYVIGVTNGDMSVILGLSYIYCDVLSVDQFNAMIGSQFGVSIPSFGWLASEIDTSAIADRIVNTNRLPAYDNIAYTSTESTFKEEYYKCVEVKDTIEVGKPVPEILYFDTSKTPEFDRSAADTQTVYLATQDQYFTVAAQYMSGEGASNMDGSVEALFLTFSQSVPIYLYVGGTASLEVINNLMGMFGEITHKGWQIDGTLNIPEKGLEIATNLGLSQAEFEQALALAFADPVVTFNDPQGIFGLASYEYYIGREEGGTYSFAKVNPPVLQEKTVESNGDVTADSDYDGLSKVTVNVEPNLQQKTATVNGEVTADSGYDGLSKVTVNVQPLLQAKTITANGTYYPSTGYQGFSSADVNVEPNLQEKIVETNGEVVPDDGYDGLSKVTVNVTASSIEKGLFKARVDGSITVVTASDLNGVTEISANAFNCCYSLTSIDIPNSVTSIGSSAFNNCSSLTSVVIPDSVTSIQYSAFSTCRSLTSVVIGASVTEIGAYAFSTCSALPSIVIPNSVTKINIHAFRSCTSLASIDIPNSVTSIGNDAFYGCTNCLKYDFSNHISVPTIGIDVFLNINANAKIIVPNNLYDEWIAATNWSNWASYIVKAWSEGLAYEASGSGYKVTGIGTCTDTDISIPPVYEGLPVTQIGDSAFYESGNITRVVIPDTVTSIGSKAFEKCTSLTTIKIGNSVTTIDKRAFSGCSSLKSMELPDSVTHINEEAMQACPALLSVTFSASITSIGNYAFYMNANTIKYDFSRATSIPYLAGSSSTVFFQIGANCKIIVPDSLYDSWIAATNWSSMTSYIIKASEYVEA